MNRHIRILSIICLSLVYIFGGNAAPIRSLYTGKGEDAILMAKSRKDTYRDLKKKTIFADFLMNKIKPEMSAWEEFHSLHNERLALYKKNIEDSSQRRLSIIAFGDSLLDSSRKGIKVIHTKSNFAINGSWAHHMEAMAIDIHKILVDNEKLEMVKYVVIGCLGGNPFLHRQPLDITIKKSLKTLDTIRRLFEHQRIIVYGIPPTVSIYVNTNAPAFEKALYEWVQKDKNAVFLPLQGKFAGKFGVFPKSIMSIDGIHFSPEGIKVFDKLIKKAKNVPARSIVD